MKFHNDFNGKEHYKCLYTVLNYLDLQNIFSKPNIP